MSIHITKGGNQIRATGKDADALLKAVSPQERLKVWWIPQVPGKPFEVAVDNLREARLLLDALANYDIFQLEHNIKPDYCNAGGLMVFRDGDWEDWSDDEGDDIDSEKHERK